MNPKTTNVLLILLLMVGAYFIVFERQAPTTFEREQANPEQKPDRGQAVFTSDQLPTESVVSVTMQREDETAQLTKEGQDWFQTQPVRFELNTWSVRQVIDDVAGLRYFQRFEPSVDGDGELPTLDQISLSRPEAIVSLGIDGHQSATQKILLGRRAVGGRAYAMINDDQSVYVVNDALHQAIFDQGIKQWRKRSIHAPTEGQAQRVVLSRRGRTITVRKADGSWSFGAPDSGRVDSDAVKGLLSAIGNLNIQKFVADYPQDIAIYGFDQPGTILSVDIPAATSSDSTQKSTAAQDGLTPNGHDTSQQLPVVKTLQIGAAADLKNEQFFATWASEGDKGHVVFTILASDVEEFAKSVDDLRDARITPIALSDIRELTIHQPPAEAVGIVRGPEGWSFVAPGPGYEADSASVALWVEALTEARATAYEPQLQLAVDPLATFTIVAIGRTEPDVLRIYPRGQADTYPVLRNNETVLYRVAKTSVEKLLKPIVSLRQKTVLQVDSDELIRLAIERAGGTTYRFERTKPVSEDSPAATTQTQGSRSAQSVASTWRLLGHEGYEVQTFGRLLPAFTPLRAAGWNVSPSSEHSPADRLITVRLELAGGGRHSLLVDPDRRLGRLANLSSDEEWFELGQEFVELVSGEFHIRTVLPADINQIDSVEIIRGETSLSIHRDQHNQYVAQNDVDIDQSVAGRLFDTLAGLRVDRFTEPKHISLPPLKVVLKSSDGQTYRLAFAQPKDPQAAVTNGDQWFTLGAETLDQLNAAVAELWAKNSIQTDRD